MHACTCGFCLNPQNALPTRSGECVLGIETEASEERRLSLNPDVVTDVAHPAQQSGQRRQGRGCGDGSDGSSFVPSSCDKAGGSAHAMEEV